MEKTAKIYVAGHRGLVGSGIIQTLHSLGFNNLVVRTSSELDLREQSATREFFRVERPEYVFLAAAKVGGIHANSTYPAQFIYDNLAIELNIIKAAKDTNVKKLLFLGSSCIYPRMAPQPLREEYLLTGELEPTNEPYAIAKIAGIKLCQAFNREYGTHYISVMPTNLYGPGDNFDLTTSHVLPALIRKFHEAKIHKTETVEVWGTGKPRREFLYIDDLASACVFLMENYNQEGIVNIGTGNDLTIQELAEKIRGVVGYQGRIIYDPSKPDGTPEKRLDVCRLRELGWTAKVSLSEGLQRTYAWYCGTKH